MLTAAAMADDAVLDVVSQQLDADRIQRRSHRCDLIQNVDAVTIFLDHPLNAGDLSGNSFEADAKKASTSNAKTMVVSTSTVRSALEGEWLPEGSCYRPGIFELLIGADPILCVPSCPVLVEQALTNRPVSSIANATNDMVMFFLIWCF